MTFCCLQFFVCNFVFFFRQPNGFWLYLAYFFFFCFWVLPQNIFFIARWRGQKIAKETGICGSVGGGGWRRQRRQHFRHTFCHYLWISVCLFMCAQLISIDVAQVCVCCVCEECLLISAVCRPPLGVYIIYTHGMGRGACQWACGCGRRPYSLFAQQFSQLLFQCGDFFFLLLFMCVYFSVLCRCAKNESTEK